MLQHDVVGAWGHVIQAVRIVTLAHGPRLAAATCVDGASAAPPAGCGRAWGSMDLCAAWTDPAHPRRAQRGDICDPDRDQRGSTGTS